MSHKNSKAPWKYLLSPTLLEIKVPINEMGYPGLYEIQTVARYLQCRIGCTVVYFSSINALNLGTLA